MLVRRSSTWIGSLTALALVLLAGSTLPLAAPLEERAVLAAAPLIGAVEGALRPLAALLLNAGDTTALAADNATLRLENARLEGEVVALRERLLASTQVEALELGVGAHIGRHVTAPILLRDPAPGREIILIGRGRDAGLAEGQPALGPGATLVGIVVHVEEHTARVRLLTDRASAVSALLERSREPAALAGGRDGLHLEFVPIETTGVEGDVVLSAALGGQLPPGLPIGRVTGVTAVPGDLFQRVAVEPLADYRRLEHVLVLVDFLPPAGPKSPAAP